MQTNNLPPEGWVLKMEHEHPRKGEVMEWLLSSGVRDLSLCSHVCSSGVASYADIFLPSLPRLSMDEFISLTIDFEKEPEVGSMVEVSETGMPWLKPEYYIGRTKDGLYVTEDDMGNIRGWDHIRRPVQPLTISLSEAEKRLSEIKKQVVKIEG